MHNIVLIAARYPWPARTGDRLRALQTASMLARNAAVTLVAPRPRSAPEPPPDLPFELRLLPSRRSPRPGRWLASLARGLPLQNLLFEWPELEAVLPDLTRQADTVVVQLVRQARLAAEVEPERLVVDFIDCLSLNVATRARVDKPVYRALLRQESARLQAAEAQMVRGSRAALVVSERDRSELARSLGDPWGERLRTVPLVMEAQPEIVERRRRTVVLSGNLGYFPNRDAAVWFLDHVWKPAAERDIGLRLVLAGSRIPRAVERRAEALGAEVLRAPPDLRRVVASAAVAVAPLRCGSGVPVKVLEAWAAGTPVVASPWAAAGAAGDDGDELLIADSPEQWLLALEQLRDDESLRDRLRSRALQRLQSEHHPDAVAERLWRAVSGAS